MMASPAAPPSGPAGGGEAMVTSSTPTSTTQVSSSQPTPPPPSQSLPPSQSSASGPSPPPAAVQQLTKSDEPLASTSAVTLDHTEPVASNEPPTQIKEGLDDDENAQLLVSLANGVSSLVGSGSGPEAEPGKGTSTEAILSALAMSAPGASDGIKLEDSEMAMAPESNGAIDGAFAQEEDTQEHGGPIQAYAKLEFPGFSYYIQTLDFTVGRRPAHIRPAADSATASRQHITGAQKAEGDVDVDLGPLKSISRLHVRIFYQDQPAMPLPQILPPGRSMSEEMDREDFQDQGRFVLQVNGRNGAFVDDVYVGKDGIVPLGKRTKIQIAERVFYFVLPPSHPPAGSHIDDDDEEGSDDLEAVTDEEDEEDDDDALSGSEDEESSSNLSSDGEEDEEEDEEEEAEEEEDTKASGKQARARPKLVLKRRQGGKGKGKGKGTGKPKWATKSVAAKGKRPKMEVDEEEEEEAEEEAEESDEGEPEEDEEEEKAGKLSTGKKTGKRLKASKKEAASAQAEMTGRKRKRGDAGAQDEEKEAALKVGTPIGIEALQAERRAAKKKKKDQDPKVNDEAATQPPKGKGKGGGKAAIAAAAVAAKAKADEEKSASPALKLKPVAAVSPSPTSAAAPQMQPIRPPSLQGQSVMPSASSSAAQGVAGSAGPTTGPVRPATNGPSLHQFYPVSGQQPGAATNASARPPLSYPLQPPRPPMAQNQASPGVSPRPAVPAFPPSAAAFAHLAANTPSAAPQTPKLPEGPGEKPELSTLQLIIDALNSPLSLSRGGKLTLQEIYDDITGRYEWYRNNGRQNGRDWHSSIRHTVGSSRDVTKITRRPDEPGKGLFYAMVTSEAAARSRASPYNQQAMSPTPPPHANSSFRPPLSSSSASPMSPAIQQQQATASASASPRPGGPAPSFIPATAQNLQRPPAGLTPSPARPPAQQPPHQITSARVPIVIGTAPKEALEQMKSAPKAAITESIEALFGGPPIVHHEGKLYLSPQVFGHMSREEIADIGGKGAQQALAILQSHLVKHLQTLQAKMAAGQAPRPPAPTTARPSGPPAPARPPIQQPQQQQQQQRPMPRPGQPLQPPQQQPGRPPQQHMMGQRPPQPMGRPPLGGQAPGGPGRPPQGAPSSYRPPTASNAPAPRPMPGRPPLSSAPAPGAPTPARPPVPANQQQQPGQGQPPRPGLPMSRPPAPSMNAPAPAPRPRIPVSNQPAQARPPGQQQQPSGPRPAPSSLTKADADTLLALLQRPGGASDLSKLTPSQLELLQRAGRIAAQQQQQQQQQQGSTPRPNPGPGPSQNPAARPPPPRPAAAGAAASPAPRASAPPPRPPPNEAPRPRPPAPPR